MEDAGTDTPTPGRLRLVAAFAAVYVIWGSTYLAIHFAVESIPPFAGAGIRYLIAGLVVYGWRRSRGDARPQLLHWRTALIVGGLLLLGGNGLVFYAVVTVPTGLAALIVASVPLWMSGLAIASGRQRATVRGTAGVLAGFAGVLFLIGPGRVGLGGVPLVGSLVLVAASLFWALGSLYSREAPQPKSQLLATGMTMIGGGVTLLVAAIATGDLARLDIGAVTPASWLALLYLIVLGSIVAFTAYLWLMRNTAPAHAATYAYVNPVVAVFLGWLLAGEAVTGRTLIAAAVIIGSVALTISAKSRPRSVNAAPAPPLAEARAEA